MNSRTVTIAALGLCSLGGCPDPEPTPRNPPILWLTLDGVETEVKLIGAEPRPY